MTNTRLSGRLCQNPVFIKGKTQEKDRTWGRIFTNGTDGKPKFTCFCAYGEQAHKLHKHGKKGTYVTLKGEMTLSNILVDYDETFYQELSVKTVNIP